MLTLIKRTLLGLALFTFISLVSGCASGNGCREACVLGFGPGNALFDRIALTADRADPCQTRAELGRPEGYQRPNWCFSGRGYQKPIYITDRSGQTIGKISR